MGAELTNIQPSAPLSRTAVPTPQAVRLWSVGQLFEATVIGRTTENSITLRIGRENFSAATRLDVANGTQLTLRVTKTTPLPTLEVVTPPNNKTLQTAIENGFKANLPQQLPLKHALPPLLSYVKQAPPTPDTKALTTAVNRVLEKLPDLGTLATPQGLRRAVKDSGLFLEARLAVQPQAAKTQPAQHDLKHQLQLLRSLIDRHTTTPAVKREPPAQTPESSPGTREPPPPPTADRLPTPALTTRRSTFTTPVAARGTELSPGSRAPSNTNESAPLTRPNVEPRALTQNLDAAVARIETQQLKAVNAALEQHTYLATEIPHQRAGTVDVIELLFEQERDAETSDQNPPFTATLEVPVAETSSLRAKIVLHEGLIHVNLWSEDQALVEHIERHSSALEIALAEAGLNVGEVGVKRTPKPDPHRYVPKNLLEVSV